MQIEPALRSIDGPALQRYVARRKEEVQHCLVALKQDDFETLRNVAHKILGNYSTFGFVELEDIAERLQDAARGGDLLGAQRALERLDAWANVNLSLSTRTH